MCLDITIYVSKHVSRQRFNDVGLSQSGYFWQWKQWYYGTFHVMVELGVNSEGHFADRITLCDRITYATSPTWARWLPAASWPPAGWAGWGRSSLCDRITYAVHVTSIELTPCWVSSDSSGSWVGQYYSYLLPRQDGGRSQIRVSFFCVTL